MLTTYYDLPTELQILTATYMQPSNEGERLEKVVYLVFLDVIKKNEVQINMKFTFIDLTHCFNAFMKKYADSAEDVIGRLPFTPQELATVSTMEDKIAQCHLISQKFLLVEDHFKTALLCDKIFAVLGGFDELDSLKMLLEYGLKPNKEAYLTIFEFPIVEKSLLIYESLLCVTLPGSEVLDYILNKVDSKWWERLLSTPLLAGIRPSNAACVAARAKDLKSLPQLLK